MFRTGSPYSPFFTSGLLSEPKPCSPEESSSRSASPDPPLGPRRGSLPTDSPARSPSSTDGSSAFYFTLQPKRDTQEFRSFLSLDLAESNSLRSASLKRKASSRAEKSFTMFSQIPEVTPNTRLAPPPRTSVRLRLSRDSLRTIPSPKPAPSMTLPAVPVPKHQTTPSSSSSSSIPSTPPRLPSIAISPSLGLTLERASQSAPSLIISRTAAPPLVYALHPKRESTSSVSTRARKVNRSHALARLEGRSNSTRHKPMAKPIERNFMSMSDDEDDSDLEEEHPRITLSAVLEPEDVVLPPPSAVRMRGSRSAPISGSFPSLVTSRSSSSRIRRTSKEWFPLKSFIDLQSDEEMSGWSWRSFIEVASVS